MDESADAERFFTEVDEQAHPVASLMEVEQALFGVLGKNHRPRLCFENNVVRRVRDDEVNSPLRYHRTLVENRNLDFALELKSTNRQRDFERPLIVDLGAMEPQLTLHVNTRANHDARKCLEIMSGGRTLFCHKILLTLFRCLRLSSFQ